MESKACLIEGLKAIVEDSLTSVNKKDTVDILNWGLQPKFLELEKSKAGDYGVIVPMMFQSLEGTAYYKDVADLR